MGRGGTSHHQGAPDLRRCVAFNPDSWLFTGIPETSHLSIRSAQHIFERTASKAGIRQHPEHPKPS
jgi:hypothetical protein